MSSRVRVNGHWLDRIAPTTGLQDSTIYRTLNAPGTSGEMSWSGDYMAEVSWAAGAGFAAPWFRRGSVFEVCGSGGREWGGVLAEPSLNDDGTWSLTAYGFGAQAEEFQALGGDDLPSWVPNTVVDRAIGDGLPWKRYASLGTAAVADAPGDISDVATVLSRAALRSGKRWWVDSFGEVSLVSDPIWPTWAVLPGSAYMGTADEEFVTHLFGYYVSSVDGVTGEPDGWAMASAFDAEAASIFGRRERTVDLTGLGLLGGTAAQENIDGRFALTGARMGWTNGINLTSVNLRRPGWGSASPLSLYGRNGAGTMLKIPGVMDTRSQPTVRGSIQLVLGKVTRVHEEGRAFVEPVGFVARNFQGALAAAQASSASVVAA